MTEDSLDQAIYELVAPLAASMGLAIWGVEFSSGKRSMLRVYVQDAAAQDGPPPAADAEETEDASAQGVTIDQCAKLSRSLGLALDVEDLIPGAYVLEVSSPGISRPFFSPQQMQDYVGQNVELVLHEPRVEEFPGRKSFKGPLREVQGDILHLDVEDSAEGDAALVQIQWSDLKKARLAPEIAVPAAPREKKGHKKKKKSRKS